MRDQDLRAVTEVLAAGGRVLVLSDFDGTLAPIAPERLLGRLVASLETKA